MKFIINRQKLISGLQDVMKAVSSRTVVPILTGVKLEATKQGITLIGSDSDITIKYFIPAEEDDKVIAEVIEEGSIVLHAKYFPDIIRKLPEETVEIEMAEQLKVGIRSGKSRFHLNGQDPDEYPLLPELQTEDSFEISTSTLKALIKQTVFAVATMESRPILTGVQMKLLDNKLTFSATDSHRLAMQEIPISDSETEITSLVIPGKSLNELNKILSDNEEKIEISVTNNQILFRTKNLYFLSRLLDGKYPETSRLIPEESKTALQIKTKDLLHTIDRASLLAKDDHNNVVRLITKDNQHAEITSNSPEVGTVTEEIGIQSMEGEDLKISFSSKYMMDALKAIGFDEVKIEFTGAMRPFIIRPVNGESILQLILPIRTY
ncbi:DNA polymerase III subunit beta [Virgibacillus kimchii]